VDYEQASGKRVGLGQADAAEHAQFALQALLERRRPVETPDLESNAAPYARSYASNQRSSRFFF
jgi:hypothetical protein